MFSAPSIHAGCSLKFVVQFSNFQPIFSNGSYHNSLLYSGNNLCIYHYIAQHEFGAENCFVKIHLNENSTCIFYYRFIVDIFFGTCLLFYIVFILLSMEAPGFMFQYRSLIVYLALPWSHIAACRSIIALTISIERFFAAYFPILYHQKRSRVLNWPVSLIGVCFGLSEEFLLFGFCSYNMEIPPTCRVFGCAMNKCFYNFWTIHRSVIFSLIISFSILLSTRLFIWNVVKHKNTNNQLSKANRLALLDTCTVLIFDFLPSFCGNMWPIAPMFSFDYIGPYNAVLKVTGCAIEAIVVTLVLILRRSDNFPRIRQATFVKS
nr:hypothetical protein C07G3.7 - Caenorhabditis elegans [Caenorhabditis elegans]